MEELKDLQQRFMDIDHRIAELRAEKIARCSASELRDTDEDILELTNLKEEILGQIIELEALGTELN